MLFLEKPKEWAPGTKMSYRGTQTAKAFKYHKILKRKFNQ